MQLSHAMCNVNISDVMPMWSACAANSDDVIPGVCNMRVQASQASLCNIDVP